MEAIVDPQRCHEWDYDKHGVEYCKLCGVTGAAVDHFPGWDTCNKKTAVQMDPFPCAKECPWGGKCDREDVCIPSGGCQYKPSAVEAQEVLAEKKSICVPAGTIISSEGVEPGTIILTNRKPLPLHLGGPLPETKRIVRNETTDNARQAWENVDRAASRAPEAVKRTFSTGATRDVADNKLDYEGFLSPAVLQRFAEYMHKNRFMKDGSVRDSDNWQKGIPLDAYMKSMFRHFMEVWCLHRGVEVVRPEEDDDWTPDLEDSLAGLLFNVQGMLHEVLKQRRDGGS